MTRNDCFATRDDSESLRAEERNRGQGDVERTERGAGGTDWIGAGDC